MVLIQVRFTSNCMVRPASKSKRASTPTPASSARKVTSTPASLARRSAAAGRAASSTAPARGRNTARVRAQSSNQSTPTPASFVHPGLPLRYLSPGPPIACRSSPDHLDRHHGQADHADEQRGRVPLGLAGLQVAQPAGELAGADGGAVDRPVDHALVDPVGGGGEGADDQPDDALLVEVVEEELALQGLVDQWQRFQVLALRQAAPVQPPAEADAER